MNVLKKTLVKDLASHEYFFLNVHDSLSEGLRVLGNHYGLLSGPILNRASNECSDSLHILDVISYVLRDEDKIKDRFLHSVVQAIGASEKAFLPIYEDTRIEFVIKEVFSNGVHQVPVMNAQRQLSSILTQFHVVPFLRKNLESDVLLKQLSQKRIQEEYSIKGDVIFVRDQDTLLHAFQSIAHHRVTGIAVVDAHNKLVGNISATDFEIFNEDNFVQLQSKVSDFIRQQRPICCTPHTTIGEVIQYYSDCLIHRLYIVDHNSHPIGVLSLTDLMKILGHHL